MSAKWTNVKSGNKTWVHSAAALSAGHVVYNVKYLGSVEVSAPKGADIVKEAVTKLKFNKQVKRSEGTKPPKMELTISVDGVTIQDRQTKEQQFTYPLHHISYCADDKSDKKICAFIAKDTKENKNVCHVMESDKNAEEITLTVGQAFDLAYQKFLANANKTQEQQQQNDHLKKRVSTSPARSPQMGRMYSHGTFRNDSPPSRGATPPLGRATPPTGRGTPPTGRGTPPTGRGTPPLGRGTPPGVGTPPTSRQDASPRFARSPQTAHVASVKPLPPAEASLPPPPAALLETKSPTLHPPPPSPPPPPPPQALPSAPETNLPANPTTDPNTPNPTPDTLSPTDQPKSEPAPPEQPKEPISEPVEHPQDLPAQLYTPSDILTTKL